jgi:hypothetical protein
MKKTDLNNFLNDFEYFCRDNINSNKSNSYMLAIKHLCGFLGIKIMNQEAYDLILRTRRSFQNENSELYIKCLEFLTLRRQRSYLEKGFINAAINYLISFEKIYN